MKTCPAMLSHFCSPFSPRIYQKRHENARICFQFDPGFDHRNTGFDSPCYFIIISCYLSSKLSLRIKIERYPIYYFMFSQYFLLTICLIASLVLLFTGGPLHLQMEWRQMMSILPPGFRDDNFLIHIFKKV